MAYVNVKDWSVDQVTDWLKGLDNTLLPYATHFLNNGVTGHQLLNVRSDDLEHWGVKIIGHQELILEAVELLRNFHFELDKENLQMLALRLSCASNSLFKELILLDENSKTVNTLVMSDVHNVITMIKPLVCWLDRSPFAGDKDYVEFKSSLLECGFSMATSAHRGIFSDMPVKTIKNISAKLAKMADQIIQEISDPMILQPASLDLATLKKKEQELGFYLLPSHHAIHQITEVKFGSPAHTSSKIEEGDEIVQVNYQTVVGWQAKKVMMLLSESPPEIVLTLKKRPRHTKVYGQIYMKPYRLPSRKRGVGQSWSRWNDNLPSPRLMPIHNLPPLVIPKSQAINESSHVETENSSSDSEPPDSPLDCSTRIYASKPRPILQRRNTITGATPTSKRPHTSLEEYLEFVKSTNVSTKSSSHIDRNFEKESAFLRDKSASCNVGLDLSPPRPTTVGGVPKSQPFSFNKKKINFEDKPTIMNELTVESNLESKSLSASSLSSVKDETSIGFIDEGQEITDRTNLEKTDEKEESVSVNVLDIIKKFDAPKVKPQVMPRSTVSKLPSKPAKPAVPPRSSTTKLRGKLDKSHSTPAYDLTEEAQQNQQIVIEKTVEKTVVVSKITLDLPDIIPESKPVPEPFSETSYTLGIPIVEKPKIEEPVPPKPPPRTFDFSYPGESPKPYEPSRTPKKKAVRMFEFPDPPPVHSRQSSINSNDIKPESNSKGFEPKMASTPVKLKEGDEPIQKHESKTDLKVSPTNSIVKAMISSKSKAKKKNSLITKRRRVNINDLANADIQGYLHQRQRDKHNQNVHWEKRWFALLGNCLYGFKNKEDQRAACLIFLGGFTVAVASEVKSRSNAFKVYHTGTVFYFSAEDSETLHSWIELIKAATLHNDPKSNDLYSETDESDTEKSKTEKVENVKKFGSLKKFTSKKSDPNSGSTSLDRKWFFKTNNSKNSLPVPTAQFRSYRRIKADASVTTGNFTSHVPMFSQESGIQNSSVDSLNLNTESKPVEKKKKPINLVHASNPTLSSDFTFKKPKPTNENLAGFITLEELMIRQSEENKLNPHNMFEAINLNLIRPDVVYGEVPIRPRDKVPSPKETSILPNESDKDLDREKSESTSSCFGKRLGSLKKSHHKEESPNLPKAKGYDFKTTRSLPRNTNDPFGELGGRFEETEQMIYCPETVNEVQFAHNRTLDDRLYDGSKRSGRFKKQNSFSSFDKKQKEMMKYSKVADSSSSKVKLKSAVQYTPMALPLSLDPKAKPKFAFELNLDEKQQKPKRKIFGGGKQSDGKKEKTLLGSPLLHRAIFRKNTGSDSNWTEDVSSEFLETEPFALTKTVSVEGIPENISPHADYPGHEYPPVFEPETYSLADPQCLKMLSKQSHSEK